MGSNNFLQVIISSSPLQSGNHSYLLFHYSPSLITHKYNYTTVKFDPCEEQWTQEISDYSNDSDLNLNCLYSHNKFSKVSTILGIYDTKVIAFMRDIFLILSNTL